MSLAHGARGRRLASGSPDGTVRLWDPESGALLATLVSTDTGAWLVFTPDGYVDASPEGRTLVQWELAGRRRAASLAWERHHVPGLLARLVRGDDAFRLPSLRRLLTRSAARPATR